MPESASPETGREVSVAGGGINGMDINTATNSAEVAVTRNEEHNTQANNENGNKELSLANSANGSGGIVTLPSSTCSRCGQAIGDQWIRIHDAIYHPQCFCCEDCNVNVEDKYCLFDGKDGQKHVYCEKHYFERSNLICAKCKEPLDSMYVNALGRKYHPDHFTCSACPTIFGPDGTFYEHDGEAYCTYHYTYLIACRCAGCRQPIMKLYIQINNHGFEERWHPECYMIYKFWNVRICPVIYGGGSRDRSGKQALKPQNYVSEQQIYQVWTVLSSFEESTATCISDMLLQVSGGYYLEGLRQAERFIMHVDVLFASIDDLEDELSQFDDSTGLQHTREPKLLCKKIVSFFSVLSLTQSNESNGLTQELLSLVTSLAHYLKVLIKVALKGSLKAQTEYKCFSSIKVLLSKLTETSDRHKWALFRLSYQDTEIASDLCTVCHNAVETECIENTQHRKRWHLDCFVCSSCDTEIQHMYPKSAYDETTGRLFCPSCAERKNIAPGGFKFVSQLEQYSFLMRVALKRLYSLLKVKNALEHPGMDGGRKRVGHKKKSTTDSSVDTKLNIPDIKTGIADAAVAASNKGFGSALEVIKTVQDAGVIGIDQNKSRYQTPKSKNASGNGGILALRGQGQNRSQDASSPLNINTDRSIASYNTSSNQDGMQSPLSAEIASAMASVAAEAAKGEGSLGHMKDNEQALSPSLAHAERRKPRVAHTTVQTMKARMEGSGNGQQVQTRRAGHIIGQQVSVNALAAQANTTGTTGSSMRKPTKLRRQSDENDSISRSTTATISNETDAETRVMKMLSRQQTMRFLSDMNAAELFCAKHVAVSRLPALLGTSEFSQADLVSLIGIPKKQQSSSNMWSRLKTNLKKKDGGAGGGGGGGGAGSGNDKGRERTATFGVPLETLIERQGVETDLGAHGQTKLQIPQFFELMLTTLSSMDLAIEGIFRKNGNIRRLREVAEAVDKDFSRVDLHRDTSVQIAALLKKFLRELPDPLIPFRMRRLFLAIININSQSDRLEAFRYALILMPQANRDMLNVLLTFLNWVATFSHVDEQSGSKMDTINLATVITPNILYADVKDPTRDRDDAFSYEACNVIQQLMEADKELWLLPNAVIDFLRDYASEFAEGVSDLNTKELLRRCERQMQNQSQYHGHSQHSITQTSSQPHPPDYD